MSSISSVGGSSFGSQVHKSKRGESPENGLQRDLTDFLTTQGVSAADQKSILSEIKGAIQESIGSGGRPDPKAIQAKVNDVLEQHGIKGSDFAKQFPPLAGPKGGKAVDPSSGSTKADENDSIQQLLEVLNKQAEKNRLRTRHAGESDESSVDPLTGTSTNWVNAKSAVAATSKIQAAYTSTNPTATLQSEWSIRA
jgi:hypothetical protein